MEVVYKENKQGYKVLTPNGYKSFAGIRRLGNRAIFRLEFTDNRWLECTDNHKLFTDYNTRTPVSNLKVGDTVMSINSKLSVTSIIDTGRVEPVYDLIEVEDGHQYYTNSLLSSNCEFIIDEETLIAPAKLLDLTSSDHLYKTGQVRWFRAPQPGQIYVVGLDPSLGTGGDPAAIQIFEAKTTEQIGEWTHNKTPIPEQVRILKDIVNHLYEITKDENSIYYSLENNTIGEAALISIAELGEENIKGYFLSDTSVVTNSRRFRKGYNTTAKTKLTACAKLKNLIETNKMKCHSAALIGELKTFVSSGVGYAAKPGEKDDLVMATLLVVRMLQTLQTFYADLDQHLKDHDDVVIEPMPFIAMIR
jgi:intein/homing endonuclease